MTFSHPSVLISTILKHDKKINTYKFALLRAINDVVLSFLDLQTDKEAIAIPLRILAEYWFAYYYPFCDLQYPIQQGNRRSTQNNQLSQDMEFRASLTEFRFLWEEQSGKNPADGFFLIHEFRLNRSKTQYPPILLKAYQTALKAIVSAIHNPIRYAGPPGEEWAVFPRPELSHALIDVVSIPGTQPDDICLIVSAELWEGYKSLSLWIEALCIHEWSLFVGSVKQNENIQVDRGDVYTLLTARPDNRRALTWERNHIDILLMEGYVFTCPWTAHPIKHGTAFDLDHLIPLALYPTNALWNLIPADRQFNQHIKRDRLPKPAMLQLAQPHLAKAYMYYTKSAVLHKTLLEDTALRFTVQQRPHSPDDLAQLVTAFIQEIGETRNVARF